MKTIRNFKWLILVFSFLSCEEFVEIDAPDYQIVREEVFSRDETAISAMQGIYNELSLASFSNGSQNSITLLAGLSGGNIKNIRETNLPRMEFQLHEISPANSYNSYLWSSAYNIVYLANSLLEGVENSTSMSLPVKLQLSAEARFIRAYTYFYLINLYGDVPLVLTTDYRENQLISRNSKEEIYFQIIEDLELAIPDLKSSYSTGERTQVTKYAGIALLARVYLYLEEWSKAEDLSSEVISQSSTFELLQDLNEVFLANSREAIWQISPAGAGGVSTHTKEGNLFIIHPIFSFTASVQLKDQFVATFHEEDLRLSHWIGFHENMNSFFPFKYKIWNTNEWPIPEYSMVLRLAEQYLIRAEARAKQNDLDAAVEDLDKVRARAGLGSILQIYPEINQELLLKEILEQRRKELFGEWGHWWFDQKRFGVAQENLGSENSNFETTDLLYPIPEEERLKNPKLSQNPGY